MQQIFIATKCTPVTHFCHPDTFKYPYNTTQLCQLAILTHFDYALLQHGVKRQVSTCRNMTRVILSISDHCLHHFIIQSLSVDRGNVIKPMQDCAITAQCPVPSR